ncbi:MAG: pantoate--beta-alanine ligase [Chitinophagales bacterium]
MRVFHTAHDIQNYLLETNGLDKNLVGFVPTMGALHEGHISLIKASRSKTNVTVCSIFVNPTQFNDKADFEKYPVQIDHDLEMLLAAGCDAVFVPSLEEIYPQGTAQKTEVDLGFIGTTLEAEHRPGHFQGVLQVVKRLLDIVQPDVLFMGQKDYQQCMVIARLIEHYQLPVLLKIIETMREQDGLAMSSRNMRLSPEARIAAKKLSSALFAIKKNIKTTDISQLLLQQQEWLSQDALIRVEYLVAVKGKTLEPITTFSEDTPTTLLIAAYVGNIRMIDNLIVN